LRARVARLGTCWPLTGSTPPPAGPLPVGAACPDSGSVSLNRCRITAARGRAVPAGVPEIVAIALVQRRRVDPTAGLEHPRCGVFMQLTSVGGLDGVGSTAGDVTVNSLRRDPGSEPCNSW